MSSYRLSTGLAACVVVLASSVAIPLSGASAHPPTARVAIVHVLESSAAAWSKNDLGAFMGSYENAPSTTYLKGQTVVHGYAAIKSMYAARFGNSPGSMGQLSLNVLEVRSLGPSYALCIGKFALALPTTPATTASGIFTLVFHHTPAGWKIVSDHTSS